MTSEDRTARLVDEINASISSLDGAVNTLTIHQTAQLKRTRRLLKWVICGLVVDTLLTVVGGGLWVQVLHNAQQLKAVNAKVSTQALCPLYELFLRSYNPQSPTARQDPAEYDRNFAVLEQGAHALNCAHTTRGK